MMAQAALHAGASAVLDGSHLRVGGKVLIGTAGNEYVFASADTAGVWIDRTRAAAAGEFSTRWSLAPEALAAWKAKKQARMEARAAHLVRRAASVGDAGKRAALLAEASLALEKWV